MSNSRPLINKIDQDLVARLEAGVSLPPKPLKKQKPPRSAHTYRAARRNAMKSKNRQPS